MPLTFLLCEKPSAAQKIAEALSEATCKEQIDRGVPYFEVENKDEMIIICSALGHLYTVSTKSPGRDYPSWDICWKPHHQVDKKYHKQKNWIQVLSELGANADSYINACDYDTEGSLIGYMILKFACRGADKKAKRMKFSTYVKKDIRASYSNLSSALDLTSAEAGRCRHEVDWLYGINLSRMLSQSVLQSSGYFSILSMGRVQGPTLRYIVEREGEILTFVPKPYWEITTTINVNGRLIEAEYEKKRIGKIEEADTIVRECMGKEAKVTEIATTQTYVNPPTPFDLSDLQAEAYRHFHMNPKETLAVAERLYLSALISYPRTGSQKLPPGIGYRQIIKDVSQNPSYTRLTTVLLGYPDLRPYEGKKFDPAHPAIYPTGVIPSTKLDRRSQKLYDLIVKRFFSTFGEKAVKENIKATLITTRHKFYLKGSQIIHEGWIIFYTPYTKFEETLLPPINKGQTIFIKDIRSRLKYTSPPTRFNPSSLLRLMEAQGIGTKATRAEIIETLYQRKYIRNERIEATPLSFNVIDVMEKYCPLIVDVALTKRLETEMEMIENNEKDRVSILLGVIERLKPDLLQLKASELVIGKRLHYAFKNMALEATTLKTLCPQCDSKLRVISNKKTGKRFIGCAGYTEGSCRFSLPLPQNGKLILLNKNCDQCQFQLIQIKQPRRKPFISCPQCYYEKTRSQTNYESLDSI
ncbi:DNA topoisomerase I [[Eubacterium] cellulosolvens]